VGKSSVEWTVTFLLRAGYSVSVRAVAAGRDHDVFGDPDRAIVRYRHGDPELRSRRPGVRPAAGLAARGLRALAIVRGPDPRPRRHPAGLRARLARPRLLGLGAGALPAAGLCGGCGRVLAGLRGPTRRALRPLTRRAGRALRGSGVPPPGARGDQRRLAARCDGAAPP